MPTFGVTTRNQDRVDGIATTYHWGDNNYWGTAFAILAYCPDYGWTQSITALVSKGTDPICTAIAGLLKVTTEIPEAPYWTTANVNTTPVAHGTLKTVTALGISPEWITWEIPRVSISPGYYLITIFAQSVDVWGNLMVDRDGNDDATQNKYGQNDFIRPGNFLWPDDLGIGATGIFLVTGTFPIAYNGVQPIMYCTYQTHVSALNLGKVALYAKIK